MEELAPACHYYQLEFLLRRDDTPRRTIRATRRRCRRIFHYYSRMRAERHRRGHFRCVERQYLAPRGIMRELPTRAP